MPLIRRMNATDADDDLANRKFSVIPAGGAIVNVWASCVTSTDTLGYSVGEKEILPATTEPNIEASADVIDTSRDQLLFNEVVPSGRQYVPVAVTTALNYMIHLRYLRAA